MNKLKQFTYGITSMALTLPVAALAQFEEPEGTNLPEGSVTGIITNIMYWLLMMVGILGVIGFVIAGIMYLTAAGNEKSISRAKTTAIYSFVGILVALLGVIVIEAVESLLSGKSKTF